MFNEPVTAEDASARTWRRPLAHLSHNAGMEVASAAIPRTPAAGARLTPLQWVICGVAALGFAFDLYEMVVLAVVVRPALVSIGGLRPGTPAFNLWVGLLFSVPAVTGGCFGLLGGYL